MLTLSEYEELGKQTCRFCSQKHPFVSVYLGPIKYYNHEDGWKVFGFQKKQWLYRVCPKCGHEWSLEHLDVLRSEGEK